MSTDPQPAPVPQEERPQLPQEVRVHREDHPPVIVSAAGELVAERGSPLTPVTDGGLAMYDHESPADAVAMSWANPGPYPEWHNRMRHQVAMLMPVLARNLDRLEAERRG